MKKACNPPYKLEFTQYESGTVYYSLWDRGDRLFTTCKLDTAKRGVKYWTLMTRREVDIPLEIQNVFEDYKEIEMLPGYMKNSLRKAGVLE